MHLTWYTATNNLPSKIKITSGVVASKPFKLTQIVAKTALVEEIRGLDKPGKSSFRLRLVQGRTAPPFRPERGIKQVQNSQVAQGRQSALPLFFVPALIFPQTGKVDDISP